MIKQVAILFFVVSPFISGIGQNEKYFELTDTVFEKDMICIKNIQFTFDKCWYFPEFQPMIDSLTALLHFYTNLKIEIGIHTDSRGSAEYNVKLTECRAKMVSDNLISQGISPNRIIPKGYGESKPRYLEKDYQDEENGNTFPKGTKLTDDYLKEIDNKTDLGIKKFEFAHQLNRRMEIKILATNFAEPENMRIYINVSHLFTPDSLQMISINKFQTTGMQIPSTWGRRNYTAIYYALYSHKSTQQLYVFYEADTKEETIHGFYPITKEEDRKKILGK